VLRNQELSAHGRVRFDPSGWTGRSTAEVAMDPIRKFLSETFRYIMTMVCAVAIAPGDTLAAMASPGSAQAVSTQHQAAKIPSDQLDSLVAPIALYPDPMLAQTLAASTYPTREGQVCTHKACPRSQSAVPVISNSVYRLSERRCLPCRE